MCTKMMSFKETLKIDELCTFNPDVFVFTSKTSILSTCLDFDEAIL